MCKKLTVAYGDYIGTRMVGWCLFNGRDYSFMSDKQVKARLKAGDLVNGLKLDDEGVVVIDKEFTTMLMGKSGLTFSTISTADAEDVDSVMNKYYALVEVEQNKNGKLYHFITSRCGHECFDEAQVKSMLGILNMGGIKMNDKGKVLIHPAVEVNMAEERAE